jgi:hypothetical protein
LPILPALAGDRCSLFTLRRMVASLKVNSQPWAAGITLAYSLETTSSIAQTGDVDRSPDGIGGDQFLGCG